MLAVLQSFLMARAAKGKGEGGGGGALLQRKETSCHSDSRGNRQRSRRPKAAQPVDMLMHYNRAAAAAATCSHDFKETFRDILDYTLLEFDMKNIKLTLGDI